ncbi:MAG: bifunctional chorismate mutase/prephenate dehydrogenase [Francisellaceae bacterium]
MRKMCIVGGYGAMGQMICRFLSQLSNYQVTLFGEKDWDDPKSKLKAQDLVLISVPIDITDAIIEKVAIYLDKQTILADFTSIKADPLNKMLKSHQGPVLGLHPIFGPTIDAAENQVIVACQGREPEKYQWFLEDLKQLGFTLEAMSAKEHDKAMGFIQGIEHFTTFCVGQYLKKNHIDINRLMKIASPVYKMELNIIGRLFDQDPGLYANIILSDSSRLALIAQFAKFIGDEAEAIQTGNKADFIDKFNAVKQWMGDFTTQAYRDSDQLLGVKINKS